MRIGLALLVALAFLRVVDAEADRPEAAAASPAAPAPPAVLVTTDPHAVMGCRLISRTVQGYDIREHDEWRKLQEETVRRGGNTALVSIKGDRKADIFSCSKP